LAGVVTRVLGFSCVKEPEGNMAEEGTWTKVGVLIGAAALVLTYVGIAAGVKWWPFEPVASGSPSIKPSSPTLITSPPPVSGSVGATFLSVTDTAATSPDYYVYSIRIRFTGLMDQTCVIDWQTVDSSGSPAGSSGKLTTGTLRYNDDTWFDTNVDVTAPPGSYHGMAWSTDFTVYAPNGVQIESFE
jgi:hypothetical protein